MSLIFTDGFDHYTTNALKWTGGSSTIGAGSARTGSAGVANNTINNTSIYKVIAAADEHATFIVGTAFRPSASGASLLHIRSDNGGTTHIEIYFNQTNKQISVYRGGNNGSGTFLGMSAVDVLPPTGTWCYAEIKAVLHDSTGSVTVRVNGATVLTLTGVDTKNAGTKTVFDSIYIGGYGAYDDLYLCNAAGSTNNDFLGDVKIETLYPSGNGNSSQLTGSDGNSTDNYLLVDETPPNTTDYNGSGTDGQKDTYAFGNLTTTAGTVFGVNIWDYSAKSDAGTKYGAQVIRSASTDYDQTSRALGTGYTYANTIKETDPATSAAWTISGVNAAEFGFKVKDTA